MARLKVTKSDLMQNIGKKITKQRLALGMSARQLSEEIGVTPQQVYKYEKGMDRINCDMIIRIAAALKLPVIYFFEDVDKYHIPEIISHQRMAMEISRNFMKIKSSANQYAANQLVKTLAENK